MKKNEERYDKEDNNQNNIESDYYSALGHDIRREIVKFIGEKNVVSFTAIKKILGVSTGTIYHHLDALSLLVSQNENKKYYLTNLGMTAYSNLLNDVQLDVFPGKSAIRPKLSYMKIFKGIFQKFSEPNSSREKFFSIILPLIIGIIGFILCELNQTYAILFLFREFENFQFPILFGFSYILNFIVVVASLELIIRGFYKIKENFLIFLSSFSIVQLPLILYLIFQFIFTLLGINSIPIFYLIDKVLLIIFQVFAIWLLTYDLFVLKNLKTESGYIVSLTIVLIGFIVILIILF